VLPLPSACKRSRLCFYSLRTYSLSWNTHADQFGAQRQPAFDRLQPGRNPPIQAVGRERHR
jgi:hypothetical protein